MVPEDSSLNPLKPTIETYIAPTEFSLHFGYILPNTWFNIISIHM
jgi:hypothetical protein